MIFINSNNKGLKKFSLVIFLISFFIGFSLILFLFSSSLSLEISETNPIKTRLISLEPPFYPIDFYANETYAHFKIRIDTSNATIPDTIKMTLVKLSMKSLFIENVKMNSTVLTTNINLTMQNYTYNIPKAILHDNWIADFDIKYQSSPDTDWLFLIGSSSTGIQIVQSTYWYIYNSYNNWTLKPDAGVISNWKQQDNIEILYAVPLVDWDLDSVYTSNTTPTYRDIFVKSLVKNLCWVNGNHTSFKTKIISVMMCKHYNTSKVPILTDQFKEYWFFAESNFTDVIMLMRDNDVPSNRWSTNTILSNRTTVQCGGDSTNQSVATINYNTMVDTYCAFWDKNNINNNTIGIMWRANESAENRECQIQDLGNNVSYMTIGRNVTGSNWIQEGFNQHNRYIATSYNKTSAPYNFQAVQIAFDIFNNTYSQASIVNRTGGCVNYYSRDGIKIGSGDVFYCRADNNALNVSITPNLNTTRIWLWVQNFTSNNIYIYNNTSSVPDSNASLWVEMINQSGWIYSNASGTLRGCYNNYNGTSIESSYICNATGIWSYSPTEHLVTLTFTTSGTQNIRITDVDLSGSTTTTSTTTTSTTSTTTSTLTTILSSEIALYINGTRTNKNIVNGSSINLTAILLTPLNSEMVYIYRNDASWDNGTSPLENVTTFSFWNLETYTIIANWTGNASYNSDSETWYLTIISYSNTCNASYVDYKGCGGKDLKYIVTCVNNNGNYEWSKYNMTYCQNGCMNGACVSLTTQKYNYCSLNQTKCGGLDNKLMIPCDDDDSDGYYEWSKYNHIYCNYTCFDGRCLEHPIGSEEGICNIGDSKCFGESIMYCRDENNDGIYGWDAQNLTKCVYGCIENRLTNPWNASCRTQPPEFAMNLMKSLGLAKYIVVTSFETSSDKLFFFLIISLGIGYGMAYAMGGHFGIMGALGVMILGSVIGWVPYYITVILAVVGGILWKEEAKEEIKERIKGMGESIRKIRESV